MSLSPMLAKLANEVKFPEDFRQFLIDNEQFDCEQVALWAATEDGFEKPRSRC